MVRLMVQRKMNKTQAVRLATAVTMEQLLQQEEEEEEALLYLFLQQLQQQQELLWPLSSYRYQEPFQYNRFIFNITDLPAENVRRITRFTKEEIYTIVPLLGLHLVNWGNRYRCDPHTAFFVVAARLAYPQR